ncbi:hypothetical protein L195_g062249, partial [Trifolium pratense]
GIESNTPVAVLGPCARPSMEEEFLRIYPLKTIARLNGLDEDGTFVVVTGSITGYETCFTNDP